MKGGEQWSKPEDCVVQVLNVGKGTGLAAILNIDAFEEGDYLIMLTQNGLIKRTPLKAFTAVRAGGLTAIKLKVRGQCWLMPCPSCRHLQQFGR